MNDILKKLLLGKTVVTEEGHTGKVVGFHDRLETFIILRSDKGGWTAGKEFRQEYVTNLGANEMEDDSIRFWYVGPKRIVGTVTTLHELKAEVIHSPKAVSTAPATPIEPTAPMTAQVLQMLRRKGDVTSIEAAGVLRCRSLSKRISELKRLGHNISRTLHEDHTGQRYARYILAA
jgi:hypothetical protein